MPEELWQAASLRYRTIYEKVSSEPFIPAAYPVEPRIFENLRKAGILK